MNELNALLHAVEEGPRDVLSRQALADLYLDMGDEEKSAWHRLMVRALQKELSLAEVYDSPLCQNVTRLEDLCRADGTPNIFHWVRWAVNNGLNPFGGEVVEGYMQPFGSSIGDGVDLGQYYHMGVDRPVMPIAIMDFPARWHYSPPGKRAYIQFCDPATAKTTMRLYKR